MNSKHLFIHHGNKPLNLKIYSLFKQLIHKHPHLLSSNPLIKTFPLFKGRKRTTLSIRGLTSLQQSRANFKLILLNAKNIKKNNPKLKFFICIFISFFKDINTNNINILNKNAYNNKNNLTLSNKSNRASL